MKKSNRIPGLEYKELIEAYANHPLDKKNFKGSLPKIVESINKTLFSDKPSHAKTLKAMTTILIDYICVRGYHGAARQDINVDLVREPYDALHQLPVTERTEREAIKAYAARAAWGWLYYGFENCSNCPKSRTTSLAYAGIQDRFSKSGICYVCDQSFFVGLLSDLEAGKEYSNVAGLGMFLEKGRKAFPSHIGINKTKDGSKVIESLYSYSTLDLHAYITQNPNIHEFWNAAMAFALGEFLLGNDDNGRPNRIRIKRCGHCGAFTIRARLKETGPYYCENSKCRKASERKKKKRVSH